MECRVEMQEWSPDRRPECSGACLRGLVGGELPPAEESDLQQGEDDLPTPTSRPGELYRPLPTWLSGFGPDCVISGLNPARAMPRLASGFFMNVFQTKDVRAFSIITIVIPTSIPTTSTSYHSVSGLNASTKPYWVQTFAP